MPLTTILALGLQAAAPPAWVEFDRRPSGFGDSPFRYEARSLRRRGHYVRVRYSYIAYTSGVPDYHYRIGVEIDCARRTSRDFSTRIAGGGFVGAGLAVRLLPAQGRARSIAPGSPEHSLANHLCPAAASQP